MRKVRYRYHKKNLTHHYVIKTINKYNNKIDSLYVI